MSYEFEDEQAPLTKPRKLKQKVETIIKTETTAPPIEPPKKPRAPKAQKQIEVFKEKCALARRIIFKNKRVQLLNQQKQY